MRILLIEDNRSLAEGIVSALKREGYAVDHCMLGREGLSFAQASEPEVIILDMGLPDIDGMEVLRSLRRAGSKVPVLILTARDQMDDKIAGLDSGADDYLTKPFAQPELFARLRALERRRSDSSSAEITVGALRLNTANHQAFVNDQAVSLSRREFALLKALMERPGQIHTREQLEQKLYSWGDDISSNAIDVHIHNLRKKVGSDVIRNVRGVGFIIQTA